MAIIIIIIIIPTYCDCGTKINNSSTIQKLKPIACMMYYVCNFSIVYHWLSCTQPTLSAMIKQAMQHHCTNLQEDSQIQPKMKHVTVPSSWWIDINFHNIMKSRNMQSQHAFTHCILFCNSSYYSAPGIVGALGALDRCPWCCWCPWYILLVSVVPLSGCALSKFLTQYC